MFFLRGFNPNFGVDEALNVHRNPLWLYVVESPGSRPHQKPRNADFLVDLEAIRHSPFVHQLRSLWSYPCSSPSLSSLSLVFCSSRGSLLNLHLTLLRGDTYLPEKKKKLLRVSNSKFFWGGQILDKTMLLPKASSINSQGSSCNFEWLHVQGQLFSSSPTLPQKDWIWGICHVGLFHDEPKMSRFLHICVLFPCTNFLDICSQTVLNFSPFISSSPFFSSQAPTNFFFSPQRHKHEKTHQETTNHQGQRPEAPPLHHDDPSSWSLHLSPSLFLLQSFLPKKKGL